MADTAHRYPEEQIAAVYRAIFERRDVRHFKPGPLPPRVLIRLLAMPVDARPIAILCLGQAESFPEQPLLEQLGWGQRLPREQWLFENRWPEDARPTPVAC